jgi:hypothetical protein
MKRRRIAKPELSPDVAAMDRLRKAGASGNAAIRQRVALVAAERNLNPSETKALLTGRRIPMQPLSQFCKKHNLSYDWVLAGDLKGLKRTAEWKTQELFSVATTRETQLAQWQEYTRLYGKLGNAAVPIALAFLRNLSTRIGEN